MYVILMNFIEEVTCSAKYATNVKHDCGHTPAHQLMTSSCGRGCCEVGHILRQVAPLSAIIRKERNCTRGQDVALVK